MAAKKKTGPKTDAAICSAAKRAEAFIDLQVLSSLDAQIRSLQGPKHPFPIISAIMADAPGEITPEQQALREEENVLVEKLKKENDHQLSILKAMRDKLLEKLESETKA